MSGLFTAALVSSCGEDRSGEYYALIESQSWIYETMQQNYLYYQDMPNKDKVDFFKKPSDLVNSLASNKDKKSGSTFSHVDSVFTTSRSTSDVPTFGFEGAIIRAEDGSNAIRVLYVQEKSPAYKANLKRGSLIIAADGKKIGSNDLFYITDPQKSYTFTLGKLNEINFDTLNTVTMSAPEIVENENLLSNHIINIGTKRAAYICYNEFGGEKDVEKILSVFKDIAGQNISDIILDLRYNPGGYVSTSQVLSTNLAPEEALGKVFLNMTHNDKINTTDVINYEEGLLANGSPIPYGNLYIITSSNTASASEIVINCLKPYLGERLLQIGTPTFGKNVAQQKFTDEIKAPMLEFWLTNSLLSNSEGFSDYFTDGLKPDFNIVENLKGELGELGTAEDSLMLPILYHIEKGSFPAKEEETEVEGRSLRNAEDMKTSIGMKPKSAIIE